MGSKDLSSQEQARLETPKSDQQEKSINAEVVEPNLEVPVKPETTYVITEELLRVLIDNKPKSSGFLAKLGHPLVIVLASALAGTYLTQRYANQQKDIDYSRSIQLLKLTSQRSFFDELNKIRIQKIGEMWEQIDKNEVTIDNLLEKPKNSSNSNEKTDNVNVMNLNSLIQEDKVIINKNRFWLGEKNYSKVYEYFDKNSELALNILLARPGTDVSEIIASREQAKQDIFQTRKSMLLEDEPSK